MTAPETPLDQFARIFTAFLDAQERNDDDGAGDLCGQLDDLWYAMDPVDRVRADALAAATPPPLATVIPDDAWAQANAGYIAEYNARVARGALTFADLWHT